MVRKIIRRKIKTEIKEKRWKVGRGGVEGMWAEKARQEGKAEEIVQPVGCFPCTEPTRIWFPTPHLVPWGLPGVISERRTKDKSVDHQETKTNKNNERKKKLKEK